MALHSSRRLPIVLLALTACAAPTSGIRGGGEGSEEGGAPAPVLHTARTPAPPDPTTLTYLVEVEGLGLFADESAEAEALVAAWAEGEGLRVVPVPRATEVFARSRAGQSAESGEACGLPLARWRAKQRWQDTLGAEGTLRASVTCSDDDDDDSGSACVLDVTAYDRVGWGGEVLLERTAPFDRDGPWREALAAAIDALAPPPDDEGGAGGFGGLLGSLGGGVVEAKPERLNFSTWTARVTDRFEKGALAGALTFPKGERPLRACFEQVSRGAELLVEVDARGRVARCQSREADDDVSRCACKAFEKHASAKPALRSRRAFVGVHFTPADTVTPTKGLVSVWVNTHLEPYRDRRGQQLFRASVSDRSIEHWQPPAGDAFERCFLDVEEPGERGAIVDVRFDAKGGATSVEVHPDKGGLSEAQRACVMKAFASSTAPCPAVADAVARAHVSATVRRIGEKIPSPFEGLLEKK